MSSSQVRPLRLVVALAVGAVVAVLLVWPQSFGLQTTMVFAQLVAFRAPSSIVLAIGSLLFAVFALWKRTWGIAAGLSIVLGVAAAAGGGILLARGSAQALPQGELTVLVWNTQGGAASPESVARLVLESDADIVSLPEMDADAVAAVARLLRGEGREMAFDTAYGETGDSWIPTSVLIDERLGEYRVDATAGSTPGLPSAVWRPADGRGPTVVAAHPFPPLPSGMDDWRAGLAWIADRCDDPDVIIAGDLNATVDHLWGSTGPCRDAAVAASAGAVGTWPVSAPAWIASPIDHVLVGPAWTVRGARVITSYNGAGADHRPIVAVLTER
ncbi:endonuclease/exonuclease/phosphatase family protein [Microbacterium sp.]|uniref:endonuclease/exonuclease/phosphatase family protein n=1 Tax=Microbacterium sp. TaxID=51671 RepID=UPI003F716303